MKNSQELLYKKTLEKLSSREDKKSLPKVTVVTITYNLIKAGREKFFKQCINSIYKQKYKNIEHIIIDGASDDGTIELIKKEAPKSILYSEPDNGIYDAFNKGINKAAGEYIAFLNADDYYTDEYSIENSIKYLAVSGADFSYSTSYFVDEKSRVKNIFKPVIEIFYCKMPFCHQTMITKKESIVKAGMFNTDYKLSADYELIVKLILNGASCIEIPQTVANFRFGGLSYENKETSYTECLDILKKYFLEDNISEKDIYNQFYFMNIPKNTFKTIEKSNTDLDIKRQINKFLEGNSINFGNYTAIREIQTLKPVKKRIKFFFIPIINLKINQNTTGVFLFGKIKLFDIVKIDEKTHYQIFNIPVFSTKIKENEKALYLFNILIFKLY